jgi:hypothetical protein
MVGEINGRCDSVYFFIDVFDTKKLYYKNEKWFAKLL